MSMALADITIKVSNLLEETVKLKRVLKTSISKYRTEL